MTKPGTEPARAGHRDLPTETGHQDQPQNRPGDQPQNRPRNQARIKRFRLTLIPA